MRKQYVEVLVAGPNQGEPVVKFVAVERAIMKPEEWAETQIASEGYIVLASRRWIQTGV